MHLKNKLAVAVAIAVAPLVACSTHLPVKTGGEPVNHLPELPYGSSRLHLGMTLEEAKALFPSARLTSEPRGWLFLPKMPWQHFRGERNGVGFIPEGIFVNGKLEFLIISLAYTGNDVISSDDFDMLSDEFQHECESAFGTSYASVLHKSWPDKWKDWVMYAKEYEDFSWQRPDFSAEMILNHRSSTQSNSALIASLTVSMKGSEASKRGVEFPADLRQNVGNWATQ